MKQLRRSLTFIVCLCLFAGVTWLFEGKALTQFYCVLRYGCAYECYEKIDTTEDGNLCLVQWIDKSSDLLSFSFYTRAGEFYAYFSSDLPFSVSRIADIFPVSQDTVLAVLMEENKENDQGDRVRPMTLCALHRDGKVARLASWDCAGVTQMEQSDYGSVSGFLRLADGGKLAVLLGDEILTCDWTQADDTLTVSKRYPRGGALCAAVMPDGTPIAGGDGFLRFGSNEHALPGMIVGSLRIVGDSLYFADVRDGAVYYSDLSGNNITLSNDFIRALQEDTFAQGEDTYRLMTDWILSEKGTFLCLLDGQTAYEIGRNEVNLINTHMNRAVCAAMLGIALLVNLVLAFLLYLLVFYRRRGSVSLALHWGFNLVVLALWLSMLFSQLYITPQEYRALARSYNSSFSPVASMVFDWDDESGLSEEEMVRRVAMILEYTGFENVAVHSLTGAEGLNTVLYSEKGIRSELLPGYRLDKILNSAERKPGAGGWYMPDFDRDQIVLYYRLPDRYVTLNAATRSREAIAASSGLHTAAIGFLVMTAAAMGCLIIIHLQVRSIARGVERYAQEKEWKPIQVNTDDELEGIAGTMNALATDRAARRRENNRQLESYRRFAPEELLSLLGKSSVLDVSKDTAVSRQMTLLSVGYRFPLEFYASVGSRIFEEVNRVLEQTAGIAIEKGGSAFNFSPTGFDVVFEAEPERAVSAAVAISQAALAMNAGGGNHPPVRVYIALDVVDVSLGIVGAGNRIEPAAISSGPARIETLLFLCERLDAGILCTESVAQGTRQYGGRYMGKCRVDGADIRVNEIFDGDPYELRKSKASSARRFSEAVLLLYSGSVQQAKRIFLELVHDTPADGGAGYYLHLADRMERSPGIRCELNAFLDESTNPE